MIGQQDFREAMSRLGAAVNIISSDGPGGRCGFTASAVCSVTDTPPTLLVCINRTSASYQAIRENGVLCVNMLAGRHKDISWLFADRNKTVDERFAGAGGWTSLTTGAPVLLDAACAVDCRVTEVSDIGSHGVFFCAVVGLRLSDKIEGLVYFNRCFHGLEGSVITEFA
ncbi:flavin reductase [Xanthobacter dioxanivorans]|uniref:Flavin reductase n=1 Tax=Xanthobacter dioxanivorans TaxID=2528964 RepID=A0A974PP84_9HYPH|nr:flavin reductase [Xanthobacter dioxanivorans]QRG07232.1 flavin reductase [Xanthobacter dioxanivorans]